MHAGKIISVLCAHVLSERTERIYLYMYFFLVLDNDAKICCGDFVLARYHLSSIIAVLQERSSNTNLSFLEISSYNKLFSLCVT